MTTRSAIYAGKVVHARRRPKKHVLNYSVFSLYLDLDELDDLSARLRLFGRNRRALFSFRDADHGALDGTPLKQWALEQVAAAGIDATDLRIGILCYPRILGFVFNPISVYFCYRADTALAAVIYEVRNTFGEMHSYVAPVLPGEISLAGLWQERDKLFYVSPFLDMPLRYRFRLLPPGDSVRIRILETDAEGPILAASFNGRRRDLTSARLLAACLAIPFMTLKVVAGIHWEALRLWLKGVGLRSRPAPPAAASYFDPPARHADWTQHRPLISANSR